MNYRSRVRLASEAAINLMRHGYTLDAAIDAAIGIYEVSIVDVCIDDLTEALHALRH